MATWWRGSTRQVEVARLFFIFLARSLLGATCGYIGTSRTTTTKGKKKDGC